MKTAAHEVTSYVDQDTVYHLSILDKSPIRDAALQYHTVVRICLDDAPQERSGQGYTLSERVADGNICALEYAPFPLPPGVSPQVLPALHSSFEKSFSVLWSFNSVTGGSYCLIPIRFRNCRGLESLQMKLFAGTERLQVTDAGLSQAEQYEESFACVRLFCSGEAQKTLAAETVHVEERVAELQSAIEQVNTRQDKKMLDKNRTDDTSFRQIKAEKPPKKKRKVSEGIPCPPMQIEEITNLIEKISSERQKLSRVRPVQVFRQAISTQGRDFVLPVPLHKTKHSNFAPQPPRQGNGSKYKRAAPRQGQVSQNYDSFTTSPNKRSCTTQTERRDRSTPGSYCIPMSSSLGLTNRSYVCLCSTRAHTKCRLHCNLPFRKGLFKSPVYHIFQASCSNKQDWHHLLLRSLHDTSRSQRENYQTSVTRTRLDCASTTV